MQEALSDQCRERGGRLHASLNCRFRIADCGMGKTGACGGRSRVRDAGGRMGKCSLMFAYIRLCSPISEKIVEALRAAIGERGRRADCKPLAVGDLISRTTRTGCKRRQKAGGGQPKLINSERTMEGAGNLPNAGAARGQRGRFGTAQLQIGGTTRGRSRLGNARKPQRAQSTRAWSSGWRHREGGFCNMLRARELSKVSL